MGNPGQRPARLATAWPAPDAAPGRVILCPWLHGLDPATALWLGALGWHDPNAALLAALATAAPTPATVFAGVFCVDPFRRPADLLAALGGAGVAGVVNLPTVSLLDGAFAGTLDSFRLGAGREIDWLRQAGAAGFRLAGVAGDLGAAAALADLGAELVLAHGGAPLPGRPDPGIAAAARVRRHLAGRAVAVMALGELADQGRDAG